VRTIQFGRVRHHGGKISTVVRTGAPNGPSRSVGRNRWFRYPAGFSPAALDAAFAAVELDKRKRLVDPFAGAATAGTAIVSRGSAFRGLEAHPLIAELAQLKFICPGDPAHLLALGGQIARSEDVTDTDGETELVRRSFSPQVLAALVALRQAIMAEESEWAAFLKWALLGVLRDVASIRAGWPYQMPTQARRPIAKDPRQRFLLRVQHMAEDLGSAAGSITADGRVACGDARLSASWSNLLGSDTVDACISSPPYLNNFDYADATRLELYFWGVVASWKEMTRVIRDGLVVGSTQQTTKGGAAAASSWLARFPEVIGAVDPVREALRVQRQERPRGKEYDNLVVMYFADLGQVLLNLFERLDPGAPVALVIGDSAPYGVYIDTPRLVSILSEAVGFQPCSDDPIRQRGLRWATNGTRHQQLLTERLVVVRKPS
jgi:hypothetical protein